MFPKVKETVKGTRFDIVEVVYEKTTETMHMLSENNLKHCFEQWKILMERSRYNGGEYIERDKVQVKEKIKLHQKSHLSLAIPPIYNRMNS